jgi:hypothetical protein
MLVALGAEGGMRWQRTLGAPAIGLAVADDGTVIVVAGTSVLGFAPDGSERWAPASGPAPSAGATAEVGGMAIGADGTAYLTRPAVSRAGAVVDPGLVWALGPDGRVRWARRAGVVARARPIVGGDGTVYVGGRPLVALRPDGSRAWSFPPTSRNLVPQAIGADGTLFATSGPRTAGSAMLALAGPSARGTAPPLAGRRLVSGLRIRPSRFRMEGPASVCSAPGRGCRPATPLGATLGFTVRRDSAVQVVIRRACGGVVTRRAWRAGAGTTWTGLWDAANYRVLEPGRYVLTVRAAAGATRATTGPLRFTVVRSLRP